MTPRRTHFDSARLKVGELIGLSDRMRQGTGLLQEEAREILGEILEAVKSQEGSIAKRSAGCTTEIAATIRNARQKLEKNWLKADQTVEELISQAADEMYRFVYLAENHIDRIERRARHDLAKQELVQKHEEK